MSTRWNAGSGGGAWFDAANWTKGIPHQHTAVSIKGGSFGTITLGAASGHRPKSGALTMDTATVAFAGGTLTLAPPGASPETLTDLAVSNSILTVAADATLIGPGIFSFGGNATLSVAGRLSDASAQFSGPGDSVTLSGTMAKWANGSVFLSSTTTPSSLTVQGGATLTATSLMYIGNGDATVTGAHSSITAGTLEVGNGPHGSLVISDGAQVTSFETTIGNGPLSSVVLDGAGSLLSTENGLELGDGPEQAALTVTHGATLTFGGGLSVSGVLVLDGTANLDKADAIELGGGSIIAEPPPGAAVGPDVVIGNDLDLFAFGGGRTLGYLSSLPGTRLVIAGAISESAVSPEKLQVAGGTVVLQNASNDIDQVQIGPGVLDIARTGAAGHHGIAFVGGSGTLLIEAGVAVHETIGGFQYSGLLIDFAGIAAASASYSYTASGNGGTLSVTDGTHHLALTLTDYHNANDFFLGSDRKGGTTIYYQGPTHA